ncbi:MAG TPA: glycoside hydrolase family 32 protein, partial [Terriglobales bacterium]
TFLSQSVAQNLSYDEPWRPQYHFTPSVNFMNDPNGTVYYKGEYHLFYQYNPEGNTWGHMSWGHAVSTDLVHWQNLPVALHEQPGNYMIYSGSAVVDWNNSSGLCKNPDPDDLSCLIAIYTAAYKDKQKQHIAFSNDRGRTWTNYSGNPVADLDAPDFRDPNVFWYESQHKWVMVAVRADERMLVIFDSPDLKHWTKRSTFGPAGDTAGQWECPDLVQLPVEGTKEKKWVLIINRNPGAPAGGTGVRYVIGNFDGANFVSETPDLPVLWADWGKDFYATNTWNDLPQSGARAVWIGWFSNWQYANVEPTKLWRGAMSIPRTLALRRYGEQLRLAQRPIRELEQLRHTTFTILNASVGEVNKKIREAGLKGEVYELEAELQPGSAGEVGLRLRKSQSGETLVGFDRKRSEVFVDRTRSGEVSFSKDFPGRHAARLEPQTTIKLHVFVDRSSIEVFANDGERVISDRIYPTQGSDEIQLYEENRGGKVVSLTIWNLDPIWSKETQ